MSEADRWRELRELDKRVAELKGYTDVQIEKVTNSITNDPSVDWSYAKDPSLKCDVLLPRYSTDWREAGRLLEEMARGETFVVKAYRNGGGFFVYAESSKSMGLEPTGPEAICRAYVAWKEKENA